MQQAKREAPWTSDHALIFQLYLCYPGKRPGGNWIVDLLSRRIPGEISFDPRDDIQLLAPFYTASSKRVIASALSRYPRAILLLATGWHRLILLSRIATDSEPPSRKAFAPASRIPIL